MEYPALLSSVGYFRVDLALVDSEHFRTTSRTDALSCWPTVLHGDAFGVFHFLLSPAFHTIRLHMFTSFLRPHRKPFSV